MRHAQKELLATGSVQRTATAPLFCAKFWGLWLASARPPLFQEGVGIDCLFSQPGKNGTQLFAFDVGGRSGDDVSGDAAQDVGLVRRQIF